MGIITLKMLTGKQSLLKSLRTPTTEDIEGFNEFAQNEQTQELIQEFSQDSQAAASRVVELQENYRSLSEKLKFYRENCDKHPA